MKRKPIVWIVKEQVRRSQNGVETMDYTPAMKWGEPRFITSFDPPTLLTKSTVLQKWKKDVQEFINEFDPEIDFIIASGQPTAMMMVGYLLGVVSYPQRADPSPRFLLWRREENTYIPYDPLNQKE